MSVPEIKALDMVRQIRDRHYEQLKGKSPEEVLEFYRQEAAAANAEALGRSDQNKPMPTCSVVQSDPEILDGTPVFVGTRVPVRTLIDYIEAGYPLSEFLNDFPTVTREQAVIVLEQMGHQFLAILEKARGQFERGETISLEEMKRAFQD